MKVNNVINLDFSPEVSQNRLFFSTLNQILFCDPHFTHTLKLLGPWTIKNQIIFYPWLKSGIKKCEVIWCNPF